MNYLIVDTETKTLLEHRYISFENPEYWPEIKQIAWQLYSEEGDLLKEENHFIKENTPDSTITTILEKFENHIESFKPIIVVHNVEFDRNVIGAEFIRQNKFNPLIDSDFICTMIQTIVFCELPDFKFPRLQELYFKLFNENFIGAHDALNDVKATAKCFFKLKQEGHKWKPCKDSIVNYPIYQEYITDKWNKYIKMRNKAFALNALLYVFKERSDFEKVNDEIIFLQSNFLNSDLKNMLADSDELPDYKKEFYLYHEKELIDFFELNEKIEEQRKEEAKLGINLKIGASLYLNVLLFWSPKTKKEIDDVLIEYNIYINVYELYLIKGKDNNFSTGSVSNQPTSSNYWESYKNKIERNQIDFEKFIKVISVLVPLDTFDEKNNLPENLYSDKLKELEEIIKFIKPKLDDNKIALYTLFLLEYKKRASERFKNKISSIIEILSKKEGCYIATMCYGDYNCKQVIKFRDFRDNFLLNNVFGRYFVFAYYKFSPYVVQKLKKYKLVNAFIKYVFLENIYKILVKFK